MDLHAGAGAALVVFGYGWERLERGQGAGLGGEAIGGRAIVLLVDAVGAAIGGVQVQVAWACSSRAREFPMNIAMN